MKLDWRKFQLQLRTREAKRIAAGTAAGLGIAFVYSVVAPNWYQSTLSVVPATPARGGALSSQLAGAFGGALDLSDLGINADVERIAAVFESTSVTDAVIRKFNLVKRYNKRYMEQTRRALWSHCWTRIDRKSKIVSLSCEDKEPAFVQQMLEYFGEHGNEVFRRVSTSSASEEVRFLEQRVAEMRKEADESARKTREFEERYKIVDLDSQSKAVVSAMASLRSQAISKELQLSYMNTFSSRDEATAVQLRQQLVVMNAKFRKLEDSNDFDGALRSPHDVLPSVSDNAAPPANMADIFPAAMTVPRLRFELEQLYRDKRIRETDLVLLMQRLEMAKVNEARDTSAFAVLDAPVLPTYKSRPSRSMALGLGLALGLLFGLFWSGSAHRLSVLARDPYEKVAVVHSDKSSEES